MHGSDDEEVGDGKDAVVDILGDVGDDWFGYVKPDPSGPPDGGGAGASVKREYGGGRSRRFHAFDWSF
jgi:hypothetical protein